MSNSVSRSRTDPDGMSNPGDNCKEGDTSTTALEDGSMESIDEHCKSFATSSWTQFKVDHRCRLWFDFDICNHGLINYIDTKAKYLKILTYKGTLRQVFIRVYVD
jgi:hypothetical protein